MKQIRIATAKEMVAVVIAVALIASGFAWLLSYAS